MLLCGGNIALFIQIQKSKSGNKWIELNKRIRSATGNKYDNFPKISVPDDAYLLVNAMDALMSKSVDDEKV
jgi:hypothetical protein